MIEWQIIVNVYYRDGKTSKHVIRNSDRDASINKFNYLTNLIKDKRRLGELKQWTDENIYVDGIITSVEGLFGVSYIRVL